jgi:hypothetical protein
MATDAEDRGGLGRGLFSGGGVLAGAEVAVD